MAKEVLTRNCYNNGTTLFDSVSDTSRHRYQTPRRRFVASLSPDWMQQSRQHKVLL